MMIYRVIKSICAKVIYFLGVKNRQYFVFIAFKVLANMANFDIQTYFWAVYDLVSEKIDVIFQRNAIKKFNLAKMPRLKGQKNLPKNFIFS